MVPIHVFQNGSWSIAEIQTCTISSRSEETPRRRVKGGMVAVLRIVEWI